MAETYKKTGDLPANMSLGPAIILVRPQMGENIGMCARAMLNCGVSELRLVAPRDGWPNERAVVTAAGAAHVLENARIFSSTAEAVADLEYIFASTARERGMSKEIYTTEAAARKIRSLNTPGQQKCGILFGPERTGLENEDVARASAVLHVPLNPGFSSLNLAQAVLLSCYAWLAADNPFSAGDVTLETGVSEPATQQDIENLALRLEKALFDSGFLNNAEKNHITMRNIRNFLFRSNATQQDIQTLHGIFVSLMGKKSW
ncbi:MAG: RNA methyltransferase [Alphaproteobacteria bacterium]|nr:RNA methyltransferase [Alphaproteobacteria bacterium]